MTTTTAWPADDRQIADPFGERADLALSRCYRLLGADVALRSDSTELLALADAAYAGLPATRQAGVALRVELRLGDAGTPFTGEPPEARMLGGAGLLGVAMDRDNLALVNASAGQALVQASRALLSHPYHLRYELIEFAVFTLVARARGLLALHAGGVGWRGQGALLIGASGAGKSTLALHAMQQGMDFVTEDASFVDPCSLELCGIANFLHLRLDALRWVDDAGLRERIAAAPLIRRRSGERKHELDLRGGWASLAAEPLRLQHLVFASPQAAADDALLVPLDTDTVRERLRVSQPYAAGQRGWPMLAQRCEQLHGWELRRGSHPAAAAQALKALFMS